MDSSLQGAIKNHHQRKRVASKREDDKLQLKKMKVDRACVKYQLKHIPQTEQKRALQESKETERSPRTGKEKGKWNTHKSGTARKFTERQGRCPCNSTAELDKEQ